MKDEPFVTIKRAGSVKVNDNDTGGRRLADIGDVDGDVETLRNTSGQPGPGIQRKGLIANVLEHPIISAVVAGLILSGLGVAWAFLFPK